MPAHPTGRSPSKGATLSQTSRSARRRELLRRGCLLAADRRWTSRQPGFTIRNFMSALFFKRFLQKPFQIASIIPSSKALVERVAGKMDFSEPRSDRRIRPRRRRAFARIGRSHGRAIAPLSLRIGPGFFARSGAAVCRRSARHRDQSRRRQPFRRTRGNAASRSAITSFPASPSAFSRSKRSAPCSRILTTCSSPAAHSSFIR